MIVVDANLLIYAYQSAGREHEPSRLWLDAQLAGDQQLALPWESLNAFTRIVSNPRIFPNSSTTHQAWEQVELGSGCPTPGCPCPHRNTRPSPPTSIRAEITLRKMRQTSTSPHWRSPTDSSWPHTMPDSDDSKGSGGSIRWLERRVTRFDKLSKRGYAGEDGSDSGGITMRMRSRIHQRPVSCRSERVAKR